MRYLLDVNALVAFGHSVHLFHARVVGWAAKIGDNEIPQFATSPITELGFVRIMSQAYGVTIIEAQDLLASLMKFEYLDFKFIEDDISAHRLPPWVIRANQTTDGHLLELAKANDCQLATLDERIPGAFVVPE